MGQEEEEGWEGKSGGGREKMGQEEEEGWEGKSGEGRERERG